MTAIIITPRMIEEVAREKVTIHDWGCRNYRKDEDGEWYLYSLTISHPNSTERRSTIVYMDGVTPDKVVAR